MKGLIAWLAAGLLLFSVNAAAQCPDMTIAPTSLPNGTTGTLYPNTTFSQTGSPAAVTWSNTGSLPNGLAFSGAGVLSGTPTQSGTFVLRVVGTDANGCNASQILPLTIAGTAPTITSANSTAFISGTAGSFLVTTSGSPAPTLSASGALPGTVTFVDNLDGTATLSGTAPTGGTFPITITATNGILPDATQNFTLNVNTRAAPAGGPFSVPEDSANGAAVGTVAANDPDGGQTHTFAITGGDPLGAFSIGSTTGAITVNVPPGLDFETTPSYTLTVTATDNGPGALVGTGSVTVNVTDFSKPPVLTAGATLNYTENDPATAIDTTITVNDGDSANLVSATVSITAGFQTSEDVLACGACGAIVPVYTPATGILSLTGSATLANYQLALRSVTYENSSNNPNTAARTITWVGNDGSNPSNAVTSTVNVAAVNDAPVLTAGATLNYTENQVATAIDTTITVADTDDTNLESATVSISANFQSGQDVLACGSCGTLVPNYNAGSGILTLTGSATLAVYQTALRSVTYFNSSENPSAASRTVTWIANDGTDSSVSVTSTVNVTPVNDAPTGAVPAGSPFAITGNVRRGLAAGTLLVGATDPEGDSPLTAQLFGVPTNNATVVVNPDGSFTYNPGAGYDGAATFQFQVCDPSVACGSAVTVGVTISGMIWFIDDSAAAGTGRLTDPMNSISTFGSVNNGTGNNPAANDNIFVYNGTYSATLTLLAGQRLFGEGMSVTLSTASGITPPAGSDILPPTVLANRPAWTSNGTTLTLASSNIIRGFNIGNSTTTKISGTAFGTLSVSEIALSGTGQALNLNNGTFAVGSGFDSIATTSSTASGLSLVQVGGPLTIGGTTVAASTAQGIFVNQSTGDFNFGNTSVTGGTDGVALQNNSAGTRTFGTLAITTPSATGFLHSAAGGISTAGATTITNPAGTGLSILNSTTAVTFAATTVNKAASAGPGVNINASTGTITFANLAVTTQNGTAVTADNSTLVVVTAATGAISATGGAALNSSGTGWNGNFASATSSGSGTQGINLNNITGTLNLGTGSITTAVGTSFFGQGTLGTTTYGGSITKANDGKLVVISGASAGSVALSGNLSCTATCDGIDVLNRGAGTIAFSGASKVLTTAASPAVTLDNNDAATINFTGGGLAITTTSGVGFNATNGATAITVQGAGNTINRSAGAAGAALNVSDSTIGGSGLNFVSIAAAGGTNGIVLSNTGAGGLTVAGDGSLARNASGGIISAISDDCVALNNAQNVTLRSMDLLSCGDTAPSLVDAESTVGDHSVQINGGSNVVLSGLFVQNPDGGGLLALNLGGTNRVNSNSRFTRSALGGSPHALYIRNETASMTLFEFAASQISTFNTLATIFDMRTAGTASARLDVIGASVFEDLTNQAITAVGGDLAGSTGTLTTNINGNFFRNANGVSENNVGILSALDGIHVATVQNNIFDNVAEDGSIANTSVIRTQNADGQVHADILGNTIRNITYPTGGRHMIGHINEPIAFAAGNVSNLRFNNNTAISNISFTNSSREFAFVDYRDPAAGGNVRINSNNFSLNGSVPSQQAIEMRMRQLNSSTVNLRIDGNTGSHSVPIDYVDLDLERTNTLNATVTANAFTNTNGAPGDTIDIETEAGAAPAGAGTACMFASGNTLNHGAGSNNGTMRLAETVGDLNIATHANGAAVATANSIPGANVTVVGALDFSQPVCTLPPL